MTHIVLFALGGKLMAGGRAALARESWGVSSVVI